MNQITKTDQPLVKGRKVYFEDASYQGNGVIHYIPNDEEQEFQNIVHGENAISVNPVNGHPRFVPLSQIVLL